MKKWIKVIMMSCFMLLACLGLSACKENEDIENHVFLNSGIKLEYIDFAGYGGGYSVAAYNGIMPDVEIPKEYNGIPIVHISSFAFSDREIMFVTVSENIREIDSDAFVGSSIQSIILPKSLKRIGRRCFKDCNSLFTVYYRGDVSDWINISFADEDSNPMFFAESIYLTNSQNKFEEVTEITLPENLTVLNDYALAGFNKVTNINFGNTLEKIGKYAFYNCSSLQTLTLPDSLRIIEDFAFSGCSGITRLELPAQLKLVGGCAFYNCSNLENIYYHGSTEDWCNINLESTPVPQAMRFYIKNESQEWVEITEVTIPETVTEIKENTFYGFTSLTKIYLHDAVTSLGINAFRNCGIFSITIPKSLTNFGPNAFEDCNNLKKVYYDGTIGDWCNNEFYYSPSTPMNEAYEFYIKNGNGYDKIATIDIPNNITEIKDNAFYGFAQVTEFNISNNIRTIGRKSFAYCSGLTYLNIPEGVKIIREFAFSGCSNMEYIIIPNTIEEIEEYVFRDNINVYYKGTAENLSNINIHQNNEELNAASIYYYIENENDVPADGGNYWHYDTDGKTPVIWE